MPDKQTLLKNVAFLQLLPPERREDVIGLFTDEHYSFGDVIVSEGDEADAFFILATGRARVLKKGKDGEEVPLNVLRPGDEFGEAALLEGGSRNATVRASSEVTALKLSRRDFGRLLETNPDLESYISLKVQHRGLHNFLNQLTQFGQLPLPALRGLVDKLQRVRVPKGELIIRQGDGPGPMYIIKSGKVRIFAERNGDVRNLAFMRAGDFFGELSVLEGAERSASAECLGDCELLYLDQDSLKEITAKFPELREVFEERLAMYRADQEARVPLDFREEMLPADAATFNKVRMEGIQEEEEPRSRAALEPFESPEGYFKKKEKGIRRFPFVAQIDEMDCGAASLAMVCRYYGKEVSLARIRDLAHVSYDGTSLLALTTAASELGLAARSVKAGADTLDALPVPAVVHWQKNHWIVLIDVTETHVRVADPGVGIVKMTREAFLKDWSGYAALFDYTDAFEQAPEGRPAIAWVLDFVLPYRWVLVQVLFLALVASGLQLLFPIFTQVIVDKVIVESDSGLLYTIILAMVLALLLMLVTRVIQQYLLSFVAVRVDSSVLDYLTRRLLALPMSYFSTRRTGDIQRRLQGTREVRTFVVQNAIGGVLSVVQIFAYLSLMAFYSVKLFVIFLVTAPMYAGLMVFSSKILRPIFSKLEEAYGRYSSHQIDAIKGIEAVKASAAEQTFRDTMLSEFLSLAKKQFRSNFVILGYESGVQIVGFLANLLFLWMGAQMVMQGQLTIGGFVAFNSLVAMAYAPILTVLRLWDDVQRSSVLLNRLNDIFEYEPEQGRDRSQLQPVRTLEGRVEIRDLGFRYGGPESPKILDDISLEVSPGKTIAVVGRSGSGKTTFIKCLAGMLEPTEGEIFFDGVSMKTLNYRDLRRQIGIVLQENHIFDGTIAENVAFGDVEPDLDRVVWASSIANAHEFILRLPMAYDTRIGESGLALSGGQRQRVAIARAMYRNPPVLIFDEATSALDTESERVIQGNMNQVMEGRTTFVIAHRLSTIRNADQILVLEKGKVAELGSHEELMDRRGLYFYLCSQQLGL